jgi:hypothetical protein
MWCRAAGTQRRCPVAQSAPPPDGMPAAKAAQLARLNRQGDAGKGGGSQSFEKLDYKCCHSISFNNKLTIIVAIVRHENTETLIGYHT